MDLKKILTELDKYYRETKTTIKFTKPDKLAQIIDLNLQQKLSDEQFVNELNKIIEYSVHTNSKLFFNQLFTGSDKYNAISELVVAILNTSMYTYEMAPVFTLMECKLFDRILQLFKFEGGDVTMSPGGSASNILAIHMAKFNKFPNSNRDGIFNCTTYNYSVPKIFVSADSHYSLKKGAAFLGFGYNSVISIPTKNGRMKLDILKQELEKSTNSLIVVATAGTTVLGSFDNINEISKLCKKYGVWLHIDAAWGGAVIFSSKHKHLLNGVEYADSLTWNPHKMLKVGLQCSLLLVRDKKVSQECNSLDASYLFQPDKSYDTNLDAGKKYIMCGRRVDILKLWTKWKIDGEDGFKLAIDRLFVLRDHFIKLLDRPKFSLVFDKPDFTNVCFWYVPSKNISYKDFNKVAPRIKQKMLEDGEIMISYQPLHFNGENLPNFFRIVFINPKVDFRHLDRIIELIENYGNFPKELDN